MSDHIDTIFVDGIRSSRVQRPGQPRNWGWWQKMAEFKDDVCGTAGKGWRCRCDGADLSGFHYQNDGTEICFSHYDSHGAIHSTGACEKYTKRYGERWWEDSDYFWEQWVEGEPVR